MIKFKYPNFFVRSYKNKIFSKIIREFVHRINPDDFFIKFIKKQKNPFNYPVYILSFDLDFEKDYKALRKLLDILKQFDVLANFAVIGKFVKKYPDMHKRIIDEGHELINHTYSHPDNPHWNPYKYFNKLTYEEQKEEIEKAHEVICKYIGYECIGFRTPHFGNLHTESVYYILKELGYKYSSSTAACSTTGFGAPYTHGTGILEIPVGTSLHFPLAVFDSWNMLRKKRPLLKRDDDFIKEFDETVDILVKEKKFLTHYFDPYDIVINNKIFFILQIIKKYFVNTKLYKDLL